MKRVSVALALLLALVKRIAEDHGGGVALEDAPGGGTRAVLWLPLTAAQGDVA